MEPYKDETWKNVKLWELFLTTIFCYIAYFKMILTVIIKKFINFYHWEMFYLIYLSFSWIFPITWQDSWYYSKCSLWYVLQCLQGARPQQEKTLWDKCSPSSLNLSFRTEGKAASWGQACQHWKRLGLWCSQGRMK